MKNRLRHLLAAASICLFVPSAHAGDPPAAAAPAPAYRVIDLMPAFWRFWDQARGLDEEAQAALFRKLVADRHPQAYAPGVIGLATDKPYADELAKRYRLVLPLVAPRMDLVRTLSDSIGRDLPRYEARFREVFPDLAYRGDIYFMFSLGGFDGGTRTVAGKTALLFGLDMIAYVYGKDADPAPFFHHELFHVYHAQFPGAGTAAEDDGLVAPLWREGLATYVAQALNPGAGGVSVFGLPRSTPDRVRADLPALARIMRGLLDSQSEDDYRAYFNGSKEDAAIPARAGYYLGYLVAAKLARRHGLAELAHAPVAQLRPEIEAALRELEAGIDVPATH